MCVFQKPAKSHWGSMCSPLWMRKPVRPPQILVCENMTGFMAVWDSGPWSRFWGPEGWEELWPTDNLPTGRKDCSLKSCWETHLLWSTWWNRCGQQSFYSLSLWHFWNIFFLASDQLISVDNWGSSDPRTDIRVSFCFHGALDGCSSRQAATAHRWLLVTWCTKNANTILLFKTQYKNKKFKILCLFFILIIY